MAGLTEPTHDETHRTKPRWRVLQPPVRVRGYIANGWHDLLAVDINPDTRELRVELPTARRELGVDLIQHRVLTSDLYEAPPEAFEVRTKA
jgi:hypothetical protein